MSAAAFFEAQGGEEPDRVWSDNGLLDHSEIENVRKATCSGSGERYG